MHDIILKHFLNGYYLIETGTPLARHETYSNIITEKLEPNKAQDSRIIRNKHRASIFAQPSATAG